VARITALLLLTIALVAGCGGGGTPTNLPPAADLLRKAAGVDKGSGTPNRTTAGTITRKQLRALAEQIQRDPDSFVAPRAPGAGRWVLSAAEGQGAERGVLSAEGRAAPTPVSCPHLTLPTIPSV